MSLRTDVFMANKYGSAFPNMFDIEISGVPGNTLSQTDGFFATGGEGGDFEDATDDLLEKGEGRGVPNNLIHKVGRDNIAFQAESVSIPAYAVKTADIDFYTTKIRVPVSKIDFDPTLTINFRVDRYWAIYQTLINWRNRVFDIESAYGKFDSPNPVWALLNVALRPLGMSTVGRCGWINIRAKATHVHSHPGNPREFNTKQWRFNLAYPTRIETVQFDYKSNDPIKVAVSFSYHEMFEYSAFDSRVI